MSSHSSAGALIGDTVTEINNEHNQVKFWFLRRGETGVPGEKLSVQGREQTNLAHINFDAGSGYQAWATLVGGECSHHCTLSVNIFS